MRVLLDDNVICVDVDDTLVSWSPIPEGTEDDMYVSPQLGNQNPLIQLGQVDIEFDGVTKKHWVFQDNVDSLKTHHHKGHTVVVWSGSGHEWAAAVAKALKLEDYVDLVMCKPRWLLDDMKPGEFLPTPYWGAGDPGKAKLK